MSDLKVLSFWAALLGALFPTGEAAWGQVPTDLTISGLGTVVENTYADYTATVLFDNGQEFEVTLLCDWSVDPETYAHIDEFGRLTTEEVPENQEIVVSASFTWGEVTVDDSFDVTIFDVPPDEGGDPCRPIKKRRPGSAEPTPSDHRHQTSFGASVSIPLDPTRSSTRVWF